MKLTLRDLEFIIQAYEDVQIICNEDSYESKWIDVRRSDAEVIDIHAGDHYLMITVK